MSFPEYGDLIQVNFGDSQETEPGEFEDPHPAVVVQYTRDDDETVVVAPVSSRDQQSRAREIKLPGTTDGLDNDSVAILNLITTVSFEGRIEPGGGSENDSWRRGKLPPKKMEEIQRKLAKLFQI